MIRTRPWMSAWLALLMLVAMPVTASAHSSVVGSTPEAGSTLDAAPSAVSVDFDSALLDIGAAIVVRSAAGESITTAAPVVGDRSLSVAVDPTAPAGEYTVGFRVVSKDGHTIESSFTYVVAGPAPSSSPSSSRSSQPEASPVPASSAPGSARPSPAADAGSAPASDNGTAWLPVLVVAAVIVALIVAVAGAIALRR